MRLLFLLLVLLVATGFQALTPTAYQWTGFVVHNNKPLPGAVVALSGTKERAVTNQDGEFTLTLPDSARNVAVVVSYAGYADEAVRVNVDSVNVLQLVTVANVDVSRRQGLKFYLRTAHRQIRKDLRRARR